MADIDVQQTADGDPLGFAVRITEGGGESRHAVTMSRETFGRVGAGRHDPVTIIEAAFRFLLDREPKKSIMARFDVTVISRYFPEFERTLPDYLP